MSNEKTLVRCLIEGPDKIILPKYMGIIISQYKDPYKPNSIVECPSGFERCSHVDNAVPVKIISKSLCGRKEFGCLLINEGFLQMLFPFLVIIFYRFDLMYEEWRYISCPDVVFASSSSS